MSKKNDRELTFDEFYAQRQRERALNDPATTDPSKIKKNEANVKKKKKRGFVSNTLGNFIEADEIQSIYIIVLLVDVICGCLQLSLYINKLQLQLDEMNIPTVIASPENNAEPDDEELLLNEITNSTDNVNSYLFLINTFRDIAFWIYLSEFMILFMVFPLYNVFSHFGYTVDMIIISIQYVLIESPYINFLLIVNFIRFWRIFRLTSKQITYEKEEHQKAKSEMERKLAELEKLKIDYTSVQEEFEKEKDARTAIEEMLVNYKEEVDTLNEALKIAARDIAEVAEADDDLLSSDEEDNDTEDMDAATRSSRSTTMSQSQKNKEELYEQVKKSSGTTSGTQPTLIIRDDGTFGKL